MQTTLYHATTRQFDAFDEAFAGSRSDTAGNSALGIWLATTADWIAGFGRRIIEAEVDLGNSYPMTVGELHALSERFARLEQKTPHGAYADAAERDLWRQYRQELLDDGYDSVAIVEKDGRIAMHVVLRAASIVAMKDFSAPGLAPTP